jgi:hypothetical protein
MADLMKEEFPPEEGWNGWKLNGTTLEYPAYEGSTYPIDLYEARDNAQMLDWIMQIEDKSWATDAIVAGLVRAFKEVLQPQSYLRPHKPNDQRES